MEWLSGILKNLEISKSLIAAVFVTAVVMYFGPLWQPSIVPALDRAYVPYLFAVMVLTGVLLLLWALAALWGLSRQGLRSTASALARSTLSEPEIAILFVLAKDPSEPLNLRTIDYTRTPGTKLHFHQLAKQLESKGLVTVNPYDDNLVSLTELGRERALQVQQSLPRGAA